MIRFILSMLRIVPKIKVLERDERFLNSYNLKKEKDGIIYFKDKSMPMDTVETLHGRNCIYYLVGKLDIVEFEHQKVGARLFRNKFFKSLLKDRFTASEYLLFILTIASLAIGYFNYQSFQKFFEIVGV